jgi:hypothetical protein
MSEIKKNDVINIEFDNKVKLFKKGLSNLNVISNWEDGKLKKFNSGIDLMVFLYKDIVKKANDGSITEEFLNINFSIGYELFNLKERVRYVKCDVDDVVDAKNIDSNDRFFHSFIQDNIGDEFFDSLVYVIKETFSEFESKYDYFNSNKKLDSLEQELIEVVLSEESFVVNLLLQSKIKMINKLFFKIFPPFTKNNEWVIDGKIDLIKRIISHLEESLTEDKQLVPFSTFIFFSKSITISKSTSDKYCIDLIKMYVKKLKELGCTYIPQSLKDRYPKVTFKVDIQKLQNHLSKLLDFQGESLKTALECNEIDSPILFSCQLNVFVYFFHPSENDLFIKGTKLTEIEDWLAFYFVRVNKKGKKFLLTKSMCHKILSNKKHKPQLNHKKITHFK